jgi:hypothetical protein
MTSGGTKGSKMKIRQGFVSNSSSSSFILNVGVVTDMARFKKALKEIGSSEDDLTFIHGVGDYYENHHSKWGSPFDCGDWAGNYLSLDTVKAKVWDKDPNAVIVVSDEYGDEGDYYFSEDHDYCYMNYDKVELDWFNTVNQFLYEAHKDQGVEMIHTFYGAGRNG